jgi:DNA-binding NarL/FixJ family response regulator
VRQLQIALRAKESAGAVAASGVSRLERQVARLLAAGRSTRDIADSLVRSEGTVEVRVKHSLSTLGFQSRSPSRRGLAKAELILVG